MSQQKAGANQQEIEIPSSKAQSVQNGQQPSQIDPKQKPKEGEEGYVSQDDEDSQDQETIKQDNKDSSAQPLIIKPAISTSTGAKSLQQEQMDLEKSNADSLKWAIRLRSFWRIMNLVFITSLVISGFYYIYMYLSEFHGQQAIPSEANIFMNVTSCKIVIIDQVQLAELRSSNLSQTNGPNRTLFEEEYIKHLQQTEAQSKGQSSLSSGGQSSLSSSSETHTNGSMNTPGLLLYYSIPGRFNIDPRAVKSTMSSKVNGSNHTFQFHNVLSAESCMIEIHVPQATAINNLNINCHVNCFIMMLTKNLTFNSVNITSNDHAEFNAPVLHSKNVSFRALQGRFQTMFLDFEQFADIRLQNGDIAIQTQKELMLNFTHANPNFCLGSPFVANPIVIGCTQPSPAEIKAYISGVGVAGGKKSKTSKSSGSGSNSSGSKSSGSGSEKSSGSKDSKVSVSGSSKSPKSDEKFFQDDDGENTGNIGLLPGFSTYGRSKQFQFDIDPPSKSSVSNSDKKSSESDSGSSSSGSNPVQEFADIFHSKTTEQKQQAILLFQPNCFGNFIMCQTNKCLTLVAGLKKINDSQLNMTTSTPDDTTSSGSGSGQQSKMSASQASGSAISTKGSASTSSNSISGSHFYRVLENQGKVQFGDNVVRQLVRKHIVESTKSSSTSSIDSAKSGSTSSIQSKSSTSSSSSNTTKIPPVNETAQSEDAEKLAETELPHLIPKGIPFLNLTGRFGNLFVNLITKVDDPIKQNDTIIHGSSYSNESINFDIPSRKQLTQYFKKVADPHNFDPTFILQIGAKITQSDNFQQWQITFNPAYAYFKPWWIGTFSFTLMSTATYGLKLDLAPGFCPFYPKLNLDNIFKTRFLIDSYFTMEEAAHRITTMAWQQHVPFPAMNYDGIFNGLRQVITSKNEIENWIEVEKLNETSFQLIEINLDQSQATKLAVIVSLSISILVGCILIVAVVYAINSVYAEIITQVASTGIYSAIEKKDDTTSGQPLMNYTPESDSDNKSAIDPNKKKEPIEDLEISLSYNPGRLFYQLFVLAPPLSAFVDYLCVKLTKQYINSAHEFYTHLFLEVMKKQGQDSDAELHDLTTESMLGNDMKTLYEKFCYLNGFLEQKLDDDDNTKALKAKGFVIQVKEDAQTESYVNVMLNGQMPKISAVASKNSLQLFIDSCCKLSTFEEDNIVVTTFNEQYDQFLTLNHLEKYSASAAELSKQFNITSKYIPQQWVVRDESQIPVSSTEAPTDPTTIQKVQAMFKSASAKMTPQADNYIIDRQKMQNHFSLLLNHPEKIATAAELSMANKEMILFGGWYIVDSVTVVAHLISTIVFIIPVFAFTLMERILYSPYSLIPLQYLITKEDLFQNFWLLPFKLHHESNSIKLVIFILIIYWSYSIVDLLYYYISMQFPQENFFRKVSPKSVSLLNKFFRRTMWVLVLISAFFLCMYLTLAAVWLMLGAILNPTAFLPYATAAATFLTVITAKAAQFKEMASSGFQKIIDYVKKIAAGQMGGMMKKMNLTGINAQLIQLGKVDAVMDSSALKGIAGQAAALGLVDPATLKHLEENADEMLKNPEKAAENAAGEIAKIASDPGAFAAMILAKMEEKALQLIQEQISKSIPGFGSQLSGIVLAMFKKDSSAFKNSLTQLIDAASYEVKDFPELKKMGGPVIDLIFAFAYPSGQQANLEDYLQMFLSPTMDCVAGLIQQELYTLEIDEKHLTTVLNSSITLYRNMSQNKNAAVFENFTQLLAQLDDPKFPEIQELKKYSQLLKVAMSLFEENGVSFHKVFKIVKEFMSAIPTMKEFKDLLGIMELLVNIFRKQSKAIPSKVIRYKSKKAMEFLINQSKTHNLKIPSSEMKMYKSPAIVAMFFNFLQGNFEKIPKDMLQDVLKSTLDDTNMIQKMITSDKEVKKMGSLMGGVLEMVSLFMEDHQELINSLYQSALAYSIDEKKAIYLNEVLSLKYMPFTTYEGSPKEYQAFKKFEDNPLIAQISKKLRLTSKVVNGIVGQLMGYHSHSTIKDLLQIISKINNCDPLKVRQFFQILILYTSKHQTHLANAAVSLQIPRDYIPLILLSKRVLDPIYVSDQSLINLGAKDSLKTRKSDMTDKDYKQWLDSLADEISVHEENLIDGGNTSNLKKYLLQTLYQKDALINKDSVITILKALGNNKNQFAKLTQNEIDLFQRILMLKNIDVFDNTAALSSDTKQAIYEFASMLNIEKTHFEDMINIFFLANADRVVQSIQNIAPTPAESLISALPEDTKAAVSYLDYMFSHQEKITKKRSFISHRFGELFPFIKLPKAIVMKLLFNSDEQLDINSLYQFAFLVIGKNDQGQIPQETFPVMNKVLAFLTSTLNSSNLDSLRAQLVIQETDGEPKEISDGQATLISMLNENSQTRSVTIFLDFIKLQTKRTKQDDTHTLPGAVHLFSVLYLFFTGKQSNLKITVDEEGKPSRELSIVQYLSSQMDLKPEFFESLHTFFLMDNQRFTNIMVKYMRRVQACDYEQKNPGVKIPLQSLVKIPDQFVLNFINLITGEAYSTSFFAKELKLNQTLVDFISIIMKLQNPHTDMVDKSSSLALLSSKTQQVNQLLTKLAVNGNELSILILLMFQDYDPQNIQNILQGLNLLGKTDEPVLRQLLAIDQVIKVDGDLKESLAKITSLLKGNQLIKDMKQEPEDVIIAKALIQGQFGLTEGFLKSNWQHLQYPDCASRSKKNYSQLMVGIIGAITGNVNGDFNVNKFIRDLYQKLKGKSSENLEVLPPSNKVEYSLYLLAKHLQLDPWVMMLTQGIPSAWVSLQQIYTIIQDQENEFLNPILVIQAFLTFQLIPPLQKELFAEEEMIRLVMEYKEDPDFKSYLKLNEITIDPYFEEEFLQGVQKVKNVTFGSLPETRNEMRDTAIVVGMNPEIFELINFTNEEVAISMKIAIIIVLKEGFPNNESFQIIADQMQTEDSPTFPNQKMSYEEAVMSIYDQSEQQEHLDMLPLVYEALIQRVYQEVQTLNLDPRTQKKSQKFNDDNFEDQLSYRFFSPDNTPYFNMGLCTTFSTLRKAYWECGYNTPRGDDDHQKIVATHLDYVFTTIERFYHFRGYMDFFSKARAFQLVGLAVGFTFTAENLIIANCNAPFVSYARANKLYEMMIKKSKNLALEKQQWKWSFFFDMLKSRETSTLFKTKYFKVYDFEQMCGSSIVDIENEPENFIKNCVQTVMKFNLEDYMFDMGELPQSTDSNKFARYKNQDMQSLKSEQKNKKESLRKELIEAYIKTNCNDQQKRNYDDLVTQQQQATAAQQGQRSNQSPAKAQVVLVKQEPNFLNTVDVRSGIMWHDVYAQQDKWAKLARQENYQQLIDILKGNYESLLQSDTYFTQEKYLASVQIMFGIIALSGSFHKVLRGWRMNKSNNLSQYLNSCCWNTQSNKKNMAEILQIFFGCYDSMPALAAINQTDQDLLDSFIKISCKLANSDDQQKKCLSVIISNLDLSSKDQDVLVNLIKSYLGDYSQYYSLAEYSNLFTPPVVQKFAPVSLSGHMGQKRTNNNDIQPEVSALNEKAPEPEVKAPAADTKKKEEAKKDDKKSTDDKKKGKGLDAKDLLGGKKESKRKVREPENTETRYFNGRKILNKILFSLDQSQMHKIEKIDFERFDFIKHTNLSIDQEENDQQFKIVLWQLACSLTRETIIDPLALPLISEADFQKEDDKYVKDFDSKYDLVDAYLKILTNLINDDYSFFFQETDHILKALKDLNLIQTDEDINFMRSLIGLKSNKMSTLQNHIKLAKKNKKENKVADDSSDEDDPYINADMDDQVDQLVKSNILQFRLQNKDANESEELSKKVAQLFLGLSSGNINKIVESLMNSDSMSASFVLSLSLWKNINHIFSNMDIMKTKQVQDEIFPSIVMLPLLMFHKINDQQDKVKGAPRHDQTKIVLQSLMTLVTKITQIKPSEKTYELIYDTSEANASKKFSWNNWIESMDVFEKMFDVYFTGDMKLAASNEIKYLLHFMTGKYVIDGFKQNKFLTHMLNFYQNSNDLINNPENLVKNKQTDQKKIAQYIPSISKVIENYFPVQQQSSIQVFDKFLQLFVFVQVPASSLLHLENAAAKDTGPKKKSKQVQEEATGGDSVQDKILKQLSLEVLKSTIDSLMETNKQVSVVQPSNQANPSGIIQLKQIQVGSSALIKLPSKSQTEQHEYEQFIKILIYAVMELLTGYDISEAKSIQESTGDKKLEILCNIVDSTLFEKLKLTSYVNTVIIKQFIGILQSLAESPIKSISNPEFMGIIMKLIYLVSGQENKNDESGGNEPEEHQKVSKITKPSKLQIKLPDRKPLVELPMELIKIMFDLSQEKIECVPELLKLLKVGDGQIKIVDNIIKQVTEMGVFGFLIFYIISRGKHAINASGPPAQSQETKDLMKKIEEGKASPEDMFKAIDEDKSGSISKTEFNTLAKRLGMNLSAHRINEIFASLKSGDNVGDSLNQAEFVKSMEYLQKKNTNMALEFLGISPALLTVSLVFLAIVLALVFTFIFLGIQAFAMGGTFGAVINSLMPMASGGAAGAKGEEKDDKSKDDSIGDSVSKSQKIIQSDKM